MANTKSAKKAARVTERRTAINKTRRSRTRTFVRKVEEAIASGDKSAAEVALNALDLLLILFDHDHFVTVRQQLPGQIIPDLAPAHDDDIHG